MEFYTRSLLHNLQSSIFKASQTSCVLEAILLASCDPLLINTHYAVAPYTYQYSLSHTWNTRIYIILPYELFYKQEVRMNNGQRCTRSLTYWRIGLEPSASCAIMNEVHPTLKWYTPLSPQLLHSVSQCLRSSLVICHTCHRFFTQER